MDNKFKTLEKLFKIVYIGFQCKTCSLGWKMKANKLFFVSRDKANNIISAFTCTIFGKLCPDVYERFLWVIPQFNFKVRFISQFLIK